MPICPTPNCNYELDGSEIRCPKCDEKVDDFLQNQGEEVGELDFGLDPSEALSDAELQASSEESSPGLAADDDATVVSGQDSSLDLDPGMELGSDIATVDDPVLEGEEPAVVDVQDDVAGPPETIEEPQSVQKCVLCGCESKGRMCDVCASLPEPRLILEVLGHEPVVYKGRRVHRIAVVNDELTVGRLDPGSSCYPDIDMREFHAQNIGFTSRNQATIVHSRGKYFVQDVSGRETTQFAADDQADWEIVPLNERRELTEGSRVMFGEAVVVRVLNSDRL